MYVSEFKDCVVKNGEHSNLLHKSKDMIVRIQYRKGPLKSVGQILKKHCFRYGRNSPACPFCYLKPEKIHPLNYLFPLLIPDNHYVVVICYRYVYIIHKAVQLHENNNIIFVQPYNIENMVSWSQSLFDFRNRLRNELETTCTLNILIMT